MNSLIVSPCHHECLYKHIECGNQCGLLEYLLPVAQYCLCSPKNIRARRRVQRRGGGAGAPDPTLKNKKKKRKGNLAILFRIP